MQDYRGCRLLFVTVNSKWFPSQFFPLNLLLQFHKRIQEAENCGLIQYNFVFLFLFILNMQKLLQTLGSFSLRVSRDGAVISPCAVDLAAIHPTLTLTRCRIKNKKKQTSLMLDLTDDGVTVRGDMKRCFLSSVVFSLIIYRSIERTAAHQDESTMIKQAENASG